MGILDSAKKTLKNTLDQVKTSFDQQSTDKNGSTGNQNAFEEKAKKISDEMFSQIMGARSEAQGMFSKADMRVISTFTKEFFEKIVMPASTFNASNLYMLPYTMTALSIRNTTKIFLDYNSEEQILFTLSNIVNQNIMLTTSYLYCLLKSIDQPDVIYQLKLPIDAVESLIFEDQGENCALICNHILIALFPAKAVQRDKISLNHYFDCINNADFEITDEEIDRLIHEKIGDSVYSDARKYMDDDDLILYFAWGVDSITAKDYMFVTQKQLIRLDRELLGISQDVKRFYYEDITSMSVQQNNGGLAGMLLNATLKLCNLVVYVAGTQLSIQTLSVPEAERVVSIYNAHKNALRNAAKQPIVVQSNTASQEDDPIAKLERLSKLKAAGVLSEEEFNAKKMELLSKI